MPATVFAANDIGHFFLFGQMYLKFMDSDWLCAWSLLTLKKKKNLHAQVLLGLTS